MTLPAFIPVTVITGFLGAGKTTLLSRILQDPGNHDTAVIINEFGEVGLDHALITRSDESIIELQNGCICCTIRGDLKKTLKDLFDRMLKSEIPNFSRVILETTGLADPIPIIHTLMTSTDLFRLYHLDSVITVVDAVNGDATLMRQPESEKQITLAETIILSKVDIADKLVVESLKEKIRSINPSAMIVDVLNGEIPFSELVKNDAYNPFKKSEKAKNWLNHEAYQQKLQSAQSLGGDSHAGHDHNVNRHGKHIESFSLVYETPVDAAAFDFFLQLLLEQLGPNMLRVKGILNVKNNDKPVVIHGVQHVFHPPQQLDKWPDGDHRTRLVFIVRDTDKSLIESFFNALMGLAEGVVPRNEAFAAYEALK